MEQCRFYVEHYGGMRMLCGTLWSNMDVMWTLHISTFHNLTKSSRPWSVILKYAIVDVKWSFHISTFTTE